RLEIEDWAIRRQRNDGDNWQIAPDRYPQHRSLKRLAVLGLLIVGVIAARRPQQLAAAPAGSPSPTKAEKPAKAKAKNKDKKKDDKSSGTNLFGPGAAGEQSNGPTTTEIYSDEAFFDSTKNMGIFSGRVKVVDPRFNLQS